MIVSNLLTDWCCGRVNAVWRGRAIPHTLVCGSATLGYARAKLFGNNWFGLYVSYWPVKKRDGKGKVISWATQNPSSLSG